MDKTKINNLNFNLTELSEICGIHAGDGHLRKNKNELEISGGFEEKSYYDKRVIPLFNKVFGLNINGRYFFSKGTYGFSKSSIIIRSALLNFGFPPGNKTKIVSVPNWILNSKNFNVRRAFLRGVFDTDGCFTFDKKIYNKDPFKINRNYYPRILFTTVSKKLAEGIRVLSIKEGFNCKVYSYRPKKETESLKYKPQIVGKKALIDWIKKISPKNPTKISRFKIWKKYGFCPPYTTYQERLKILKGELNPNSCYGPVV